MIGNEFRRIALAQGLLARGSPLPVAQNLDRFPRDDDTRPICPSDKPAMAEPRDQTA